MRKQVFLARLLAMLTAVAFLGAAAIAETAPLSGQTGSKGTKLFFEALMREKPPEAKETAMDAWIGVFSDYAARNGMVLDGEFVRQSPTHCQATAAAIQIDLKMNEEEDKLSFALTIDFEELSGMVLSTALSYFPIAMRACVYANGNGEMEEALLDEVVRSLCPDITQAVVDGEEVFGTIEVRGIDYQLYILPEHFSIQFAPKAAPPLPAHQTAFQMTAREWIQRFISAAEAYGMPLDSFSYDPGVYKGQSCYSLTIEKSPNHILSLAVLSEDDVAISSCALRLASAELSSNDLVNAVGMLRDVARLMMVASDSNITLDDADNVNHALCPDLPAALLRHETVDNTCMLWGIRCALWAGFEEGAYFGSDSSPSDGYIVDFTVSGLNQDLG